MSDGKAPIDWPLAATAVSVSIAAFFLYVGTLAPGLTWAHFGADGGELIAAAVVNGVPHPPGYPLYIMLLQGWLGLGKMVNPAVELAWLGNLFSAVCAAASVAITVIVGARLVQRGVTGSQHRTTPHDWRWAGVIGIAWATAPLFWRQALITEVYALHALLIVWLGWVLIVHKAPLVGLTIPIALGMAHHLTFVLLLPGVLYWLWHLEHTKKTPKNEHLYETGMAKDSWLAGLIRAGLKLVPGVLIGLLFYLRIPIAARGAPPVNWGYADNWAGFWWLTSASAYRDYLFGVPTSSIFDRVAGWAYNLTAQFTAVGLGFALIGLSELDRDRPALRNFGLLWVVPISLYAISYFTRDSTIYLLPTIWLLALWLGLGLSAGERWLQSFNGKQPGLAQLSGWARKTPNFLMPGVIALCLIGLALYRLPDISLNRDSKAREFVAEVNAILPENSIIISTGDAETFALWYSVWGSRELVRESGEPILVNAALLQFPWYQRQLREQYPNIAAAGEPIPEFIQANKTIYSVFFSEEQQNIPDEELEAVGPLWRLKERQ